MENKHVGYFVLGIAAIVIVIILLYQSALTDIVDLSCGSAHTESCPMTQTVKQQTYLSFSIVGILIIIGLVLIVSKPKEKIIEKTVVKKVTEKKKPLDLSRLESDEREVVEILQIEGNAIFQADLMEKLGKGKVGVTRLLDKLEAKQIIERKRRGMNNIVVLKNY